MYPLDTFRNVLRVPRSDFRLICRDISRHRADVWKTRVDWIHKQRISSEVKFLAYLRIIWSRDIISVLNG